MKYTKQVSLDTSVAGRDLDFACMRACPSLDEYAPSYIEDGWNKRYWYGSAPPYSTDADACRLLEDEIERRRLQAAYLIGLSAVVGYELKADRAQSARHLWMMIRATPEQRCRAFLKAMVNDTIYTMQLDTLRQSIDGLCGD